MFYRKTGKRILDVIGALILLLLLWPLFLVLAIAIRIESPGPVFFRQKRVGIHHTHFHILKFRTMRSDTPHEMPTHMLENPERFITRTGRMLRKTSLDELPQLLNIMQGRMSFVGPRPALWNQDDLIAERERHGANAVRPGLTGWAQVNGRDELPIETKARYDGEYMAGISFRMDVRILFATLFQVLRSEGVREGVRDKSSIKKIE